MFLVGLWRAFEYGFECFVARFPADSLPKLECSEVRCEFVLRDASMRLEPPSRQRRVALGGVDVYLLVCVFTPAVDDVSSVECVVLPKWLVRSKAIGIDSHRLLLALSQQESNRRFVGGFRWMNRDLFHAAVGEEKHGLFVLMYTFRAHVWMAHASHASVTDVALAPPSCLPSRRVHRSR